MCIRDNKELHLKIDAIDLTKIAELIVQVVQSVSSSKPYAKSWGTQSKTYSSSPFGKPYIGPPRAPQVTPGAEAQFEYCLILQILQRHGPSF